MALTGLFGQVDRQSAIHAIHRALELGIRHFDTAELYGPYINEELLAEALSSHRHSVIIATKVGYKLIDGQISGLDSSPLSLRQAVEGSLRRLRRERIDLVYQHRQDPTVPVEESIGELARLQAEGKIGGVGLSAIDCSTLARAEAIAPVVAVQNEYSLLHREPERDLLPAVARTSAAFVAYSPLARGLLGGSARSWPQQAQDDYRRSDRRFAPDRFAEIVDAVAALHDIAASREINAAAVALAWLLSRSRNLAVIPGCRSAAQVASAIEAVQVQLSDEELERLRAMDPSVCWSHI